MGEPNLEALHEMIQTIEKAANGLVEKAEGIQAIERNAKRILASTKMLKINVSDVMDLKRFSQDRYQ